MKAQLEEGRRITLWGYDKGRSGVKLQLNTFQCLELRFQLDSIIFLFIYLLNYFLTICILKSDLRNIRVAPQLSEL